MSSSNNQKKFQKVMVKGLKSRKTQNLDWFQYIPYNGDNGVCYRRNIDVDLGPTAEGKKGKFSENGLIITPQNHIQKFLKSLI